MEILTSVSVSPMVFVWLGVIVIILGLLMIACYQWSRAQALEALYLQAMERLAELKRENDDI